MIIHYCAKKNAAFAMHYKLRKFLISCFKANIVPINKIIISEVNNRTQLIDAIYIKGRIVDFWQ